MLLLPTNGAPMRIRPAEPNDATSIATIYNQGIEERSSTFETTPETQLTCLNDSKQMIVILYW